MAGQIRRVLQNWRRWHERVPPLVIAGPLLVLSGYLLGGGRGLIAALPALLLAALITGAWRRPPAEQPGPLDEFLTEIEARLRDERVVPGCVVLQPDGMAGLLERHGRATQIGALRGLARRLQAGLAPGERLLALEGGGFALALAPQAAASSEAALQRISQLQQKLFEPLRCGGVSLRITASAGFCLGGHGSAAALLDAAQLAADCALQSGPGAVRAWLAEMGGSRAARDARRSELQQALDEGQIRAWFQPQISADNGDLTGFEALARWHHPERGLIAPEDFLPEIMELGLSERLSEVMVFHALSALSRWDIAGLQVPGVGVNFAADELRNPALAARLTWEIDRFELHPERLCIEVLETVVSPGGPDVITRNLSELRQLGCRIDLDDFGTGHAALSQIRRFGAQRLKIDRSYIARIGFDREAQRVLTAILSMAELMGLDTLAEGVELPSERVLLAQLGCGHVQGYGIARPMPFDEATVWIRRHQERPRVTWQAGQVRRGQA